MEDHIIGMSMARLLLGLVIIQIAAATLAAFLRRPALAILGSAIVCGAVVAAAIRLILPGSAGDITAGVTGLGIGFGIYHLTLISINRGSTRE